MTFPMQLRCFSTKPDPNSRADAEADQLKDLIKEKASSAGFSKEDFASHFDELIDKEATDRDTLVKNLSLQLLNVDSPTAVLDIFEKNFIANRAEQHGEFREVLVEELFMLLYFFKSQIRNVPDA